MTKTSASVARAARRPGIPRVQASSPWDRRAPARRSTSSSHSLIFRAVNNSLRVHREYAVNLRRVALIRPRPSGRDWELKMEPPVNRVIPIAREGLEDLWAVLAPT
jgi:hypothetical protein